jgi:hypothetical protein
MMGHDQLSFYCLEIRLPVMDKPAFAKEAGFPFI